MDARTEDRMSIQARQVHPCASGSRRHTVGSSQRNSRLDQNNSQTNRRHTVESHAHGDVVVQSCSSVGDAFASEPMPSVGLQVVEEDVAQHRLSHEGMYAQTEDCIRTRQVYPSASDSRRHIVGSSQRNSTLDQKNSQTSRRHTVESQVHSYLALQNSSSMTHALADQSVPSVGLQVAEEEVAQHRQSHDGMYAQTEDRVSIQAPQVHPSTSGSRRHTVGSSQRNSRLDQKKSDTSRRHTVESHLHGDKIVQRSSSMADAFAYQSVPSVGLQVVEEDVAQRVLSQEGMHAQTEDCMNIQTHQVHPSASGSRRHSVGSSQCNSRLDQKSSQTSRRHTVEGHAHSVNLPEEDEDVDQHSSSQEDMCAQTEDRMSIQARHVSPSASGSRRHTVGSSQRNSRLDQKNSQTSRRHTVESHAHGDVALRDSTSMRDALTGQPAQSAVPLKDDVVAQHRLSQEGMYAQPEGCMSIQTREVLADEAKSRTRRETVASVELDARRTNKDADSNRRQRNTLGTVEESKELRQRLRSPRDLESGGCQQKRGSQIGEVPHDCQRIAHPSAQPATEVEKPFPTLLKQGEPCAAKAQPGIKQKSLQASPESSCAVNRRNMSLEEMPPAGCTMRAAAALPSLREPAFESREPVRLAPDLRGASQRGSCPISRFSA
eukprot:TRINITY_DN10595_c0_g1_i2.p1 TRINITY_DN10595_c0_g1~~TRINITY_DN10595_c0_g1_i2.p1  ORF type:complete len:718 (+),score=52.95 TRINITY_DN10595_c0_g1_i2:176-2155(+)